MQGSVFQTLQAGVTKAAQHKNAEAYSALRAAMMQPPGKRTEAEAKLLVSGILDHVSSLQELPPRTKQQLAMTFVTYVAQEGEKIMPAGIPTHYAVVVDGELGMYLQQEGGSVCTEVLTAGEVFGERALLLDEPVPESLVAHMTTSVLLLAACDCKGGPVCCAAEQDPFPGDTTTVPAAGPGIPCGQRAARYPGTPSCVEG
jgi:Cyclic nucleotide-binding domain